MPWPREPNLIARAWSAMIRAAPLKEWTRLGAGIALTAVYLAILYAVRFGWSPDHASEQLRILFWMAMSVALLLLVAIVATFDVNLKIDASRTGIKGDFSHDDEPASTTVQTTVTVTPEPTK